LESLFAITLFEAIVLIPFTYQNIPELLINPKLWILILASIILLFAALLDFEALKKGKLDIVEPIWSLEIPVSAFLAFMIIKEKISFMQIILIILLIIGLILVSFKSLKFSRKIFLEKGVIIAIIAAILMGTANFFIGWGARISDALMINFFLNVFIAFFSFIFILSSKGLSKFYSDIKKDKKLWLGMCIFDNVAWIAFAFAMSLAPIAIAVALSDSYIIIAVLLGMFVNKEFLHKHQKLGLIIAIASALSLACITF